jgi:hypothetical protein
LNQHRIDLDWLIETHSYLPFTTSGTITIKEDRRIKRGMNIRYYPTGEMFYIDAVSHSKTLSETTQSYTTLHVSRGMVEKHIDKYFQIINLLKNSKSNFSPSKQNISTSDISKWDKDTWTVNKEIFDFFIKKKQYYE